MYKPGQLKIVPNGFYLVKDGNAPYYFKVCGDQPGLILDRLTDKKDTRYIVLVNDKPLIVESFKLA
ncbi:MAG: hypothetical protein CMA72_07055 [Euryarchaeota archaeon]|nr:hypothetical protein [Euryarchaeota archaeon]|tara:strand:+ start:34424 stop:34621 length:198 start_codon:yes stop_codon:yes gene_type:complete